MTLIFRILAAVSLVWPAMALSAADTSSPQTAQNAALQPSIEAPRFEGYQFLDTEGMPLPIQTDIEIEAWLARAEIVRVEPVPSGVTMPRKVLLKGDGFEAFAIFKDVDIHRRKVTEIINGKNRFSFDWYDSYRYDLAAYTLDRLLGLDRVPPMVPRKIKTDSGSVSIWLGRTVSEFERTRQVKVDPPDLRRWNQQRLIMQIFDNLVANRDSNLGNLLIDPNWRLWFVDCSRCFGTTKAMYFPLKSITQCERSLWQGLKGLDEKDIRESLPQHLDRAEIKALLTRLDILVRHFQELIDKRGEYAVLYDVDPPSEKAPWAAD